MSAARKWRKDQRAALLQATTFDRESIPRLLNVVDLVDSRLREIVDFSTAYNKNTAMRRVYQNVARHMRRRAMSHDVKRLPKVLREAARREMRKMQDTAGGTPTRSRRPSRRARRSPRTIFIDFTRRSMHHRRLETHMYAAKRAHMSNLWGYRLPVKTMDKSDRAVSTTSLRRTIISDMSMLSVFELSGPQQVLAECLALCHHQYSAVAQSSAAVNPTTTAYQRLHRKVYQLSTPDLLRGATEENCTLHYPSMDSLQGFKSWIMASINKRSDSSASQDVKQYLDQGIQALPWLEAAGSLLSCGRFQWVPAPPSNTSPQPQPRKCWLWTHPSAINLVNELFSTLFSLLNGHPRVQSALGFGHHSLTEPESTPSAMSITSLSPALCRFQLRGPTSSQVLARVLRVHNDLITPPGSDGQPNDILDDAQLFSSLAALPPAMLPRNTIFTLKTTNPRALITTTPKPSDPVIRPAKQSHSVEALGIKLSDHVERSLSITVPPTKVNQDPSPTSPRTAPQALLSTFSPAGTAVRQFHSTSSHGAKPEQDETKRVGDPRLIHIASALKPSLSQLTPDRLVPSSLPGNGMVPTTTSDDNLANMARLTKTLTFLGGADNYHFADSSQDSQEVGRRRLISPLYHPISRQLLSDVSPLVHVTSKILTKYFADSTNAGNAPNKTCPPTAAQYLSHASNVQQSDGLGFWHVDVPSSDDAGAAPNQDEPDTFIMTERTRAAAKSGSPQAANVKGNIITYAHFIPRHPDSYSLAIAHPYATPHPTSGFGWDIIVPSGWGQAFFSALILAGATLTGYQQLVQYMAENGYHHEAFPFLQHDSIPGLQLMRHHRQYRLLAYHRCIKARVNVWRNNVFYPLHGDMRQIIALRSCIRLPQARPPEVSGVPALESSSAHCKLSTTASNTRRTTADILLEMGITQHLALSVSMSMKQFLQQLASRQKRCAKRKRRARPSGSSHGSNTPRESIQMKHQLPQDQNDQMNDDESPPIVKKQRQSVTDQVQSPTVQLPSNTSEVPSVSDTLPFPIPFSVINRLSQQLEQGCPEYQVFVSRMPEYTLTRPAEHVSQSPPSKPVIQLGTKCRSTKLYHLHEYIASTATSRNLRSLLYSYFHPRSAQPTATSPTPMSRFLNTLVFLFTSRHSPMLIPSQYSLIRRNNAVQSTREYRYPCSLTSIKPLATFSLTHRTVELSEQQAQGPSTTCDLQNINLGDHCVVLPSYHVVGSQSKCVLPTNTTTNTLEPNDIRTAHKGSATRTPKVQLPYDETNANALVFDVPRFRTVRDYTSLHPLLLHCNLHPSSSQKPSLALPMSRQFRSIAKLYHRNPSLFAAYLYRSCYCTRLQSQLLHAIDTLLSQTGSNKEQPRWDVSLLTILKQYYTSYLSYATMGGEASALALSIQLTPITSGTITSQDLIVLPSKEEVDIIMQYQSTPPCSAATAATAQPKNPFPAAMSVQQLPKERPHLSMMDYMTTCLGPSATTTSEPPNHQQLEDNTQHLQQQLRNTCGYVVRGGYSINEGKSKAHFALLHLDAFNTLLESYIHSMLQQESTAGTSTDEEWSMDDYLALHCFVIASTASASVSLPINPLPLLPLHLVDPNWKKTTPCYAQVLSD